MAVERTIIHWRMDKTSRLDQRVAVLLKWSEEKSGDVFTKQRYRYNVERFSDDGLVYLHRPAFLNKGCDFTVHCTSLFPREDGRKLTNPRHLDVVQEILVITKQNIKIKEKILKSLVDVYECQDVNLVSMDICSRISDDQLSLRLERSLKVLKWLFIEQDITDWNTSGRTMLMEHIKSEFEIFIK